MRIVLFGAGNKGSQVLKKLIELKQDVVGVFYLDEDAHETIWYDKIKDIADDCDIPRFQHNNKHTKELIYNLHPDVIFAVGWRYKISKDIYSIPPKGTIVFHDSLLPKYRGFAPMNWAIINGEKETGATMFYIADDIDSGDIIEQKSLKIGINDTAKTIESEITNIYLQMLKTTLPLIEKNLIYKSNQKHYLATYTCKRVPEDGLIDWTKSSWEIYNLIRGLSYPYPNAFTYLNGYELKILKAKLGENKPYIGRICGRVINIIKGVGVEVLTGDGSIIIEQVKDNNGEFRADEHITSIKDTFGR